MRSLVLALLVLMLLGSPDAGSSGDLRRDFERELIAAGYTTDDAGLRALVGSESAPEEARSKAALLLGYRGVREAEEEISAALAGGGLSPGGRTSMAIALIRLDPVRFEPVVVEVAGQVNLQKRVHIASSLAEKGRTGLYSVLLEALDSGDWPAPHSALRTLAMLAKTPPSSPLEPDPFQVILAEINSRRVSPLVGSRSAERIREEAVRYVPEVLCDAPGEEKAVAALAILRTAVDADPVSEVREAAAAALETLAEGLLAGLWPPFCADPVTMYTSHLRFSGRQVDDESLRGLVRSPGEPEDNRLRAAQLLSLRGVRSAAPDIRAALQSSAFLDRDLALLAHALLKLDGSESVKIVVEKAGQLRDPALRLYVAQDLAQRGEPALYKVLLDHLKQGSLVERHIALSGVGALAERVKPGRLQPDPVSVLIGQLGSDRAPIRQEAARNLAKAQYSKDELRLQATQLLRKAAEGDPAPEVKQIAADALKILQERSHERQKPSGSAGDE
jgi:HEAT repeat protein